MKRFAFGGKGTVCMACVILALGLFTGCRSTAIILDETGKQLDQPVLVTGKYVIDSIRIDTPYAHDTVKTSLSLLKKTEKPKTPAEVLSDWLVKESPTADAFRLKTDDTAQGKSASIVVVGRTTDNEGVGTVLNNILSLVTLNLWPAYGSELCTYDVTAVIDGNKKSTHFEIEERRLTSWLPLGLVSVPAMADSRGRIRRINDVEARKTRQAVLALFAD